MKLTVNQLLKHEGKAPMYTDGDLQSKPTLLNIRRDQFFGRPLATCVKQILDARGAQNQGGATTEELFEVLKEGGYDFGSQPGNALRNLGITIGKNMIFQRTPSGVWGLREWCGGAAKKPRSQSKEDGSKPTDTLDGADGGDGGDGGAEETKSKLRWDDTRRLPAGTMARRFERVRR
jgi:hypothetical protein